MPGHLDEHAVKQTALVEFHPYWQSLCYRDLEMTNIASCNIYDSIYIILCLVTVKLLRYLDVVVAILTR